MKIKSLDELQDLRVARFDGCKVVKNCDGIWCKGTRYLHENCTGEGFINLERWSYYEDVLEDYTIDSFPLDNSGMVQRKGWDRKAYSTITGVAHTGVCVMMGDMVLGKSNETLVPWNELRNDWLWLLKDGGTSPCGVLV